MSHAQELTPGTLRHGAGDGVLAALALGHGALLLAAPPAYAIALAFWWNANTVAHNFIHRPFFRSRQARSLFSIYLSLVLGVPQTVWRDRHLAHHADRPWRLRWTRQLRVEAVVVASLWIALAVAARDFMLWSWVPGLAGGLVLSQLQGHYEHARGTVSHYGKLYNALFFNDGYHAEHHAHPATHWTELPRRADPASVRSRWPAVLRWLEASPLDAMERVVLRSHALQNFVLYSHERALGKVLAKLPEANRVTIVGGGLFPRTALVMKRLLPRAELTIVDRSPANLARAREWISDDVRVIAADYDASHAQGADLVIIPLAFRGDRTRLYDARSGTPTIVHDWLWRRRGRASAVVSVWLLKRVNLVA